MRKTFGGIEFLHPTVNCEGNKEAKPTKTKYKKGYRCKKISNCCEKKISYSRRQAIWISSSWREGEKSFLFIYQGGGVWRLDFLLLSRSCHLRFPTLVSIWRAMGESSSVIVVLILFLYASTRFKINHSAICLFSFFFQSEDLKTRTKARRDSRARCRNIVLFANTLL